MTVYPLYSSKTGLTIVKIPFFPLFGRMSYVAVLILVTTDELLFAESRNVMVRIHGSKSNIEEALLINAHYGKLSG